MSTPARRLGYLVDDAPRRTVALVAENWPAIERIAGELQHRGFLDQHDIEMLIAGRP